MQRVEERIADGALLSLVKQFLEQEIMQDMNRWTPATGSPQGAVISPLLSNIYLHGLDVRMEEQGYRMVRYADDFVILCRRREEAEAALKEVTAWVEENELTLHPDKTHVGNCMEKGQGFDFLGYRFEAGKRDVRPKSLKKIKDRIREKSRRTQGTGPAAVIRDLNPTLRGWFGYFKHANAGTLQRLDAFIRRRLRSMLREQEKRPGFGRTHEDHRKWPNAYFAAAGLFTLHTAWQAARQS
jgi:RNA-directed DNA polymerase